MPPFAPLFALIACGGQVELEDKEELEDYCADAELQVVTYEVDFGEVDEACPWGEGDNLEEEQGAITARVELEEGVELGDNRVVCGMDLDFSEMSSDEMRYDDHFFLTFNGGILATSAGDVIDVFEEDDNEVPIWDWDQLAGESMPSSTRPWCLGSWGNGDTECDIPETDTTGELYIDLDSESASQLGFLAYEQSGVTFGVVATGDNDPDKDCYLSDMKFRVTFFEG